MKIPLLLLFTAAACAPKVDTDSASGSGGSSGAGQQHLLFTGVADDYSVGNLNSLALDDWALSDSLTATTGDAFVTADEGTAIQINAYGYDAVRLYEIGDWAAPRVEFSVGSGANPHDAAICAGSLFVSLYQEPALAIFDPASGLRTGAVDLSAYDDGDGTPEASDLIEIEGTLYLALHQLAQDDGWVADGGRLLAIDCASQTVTGDWAVGPNPTLARRSDTQLLIRTGVYYDRDYNLLLDGGLATFDLATQSLSAPHLTEAAAGYNIDEAVAVDDQALLLLSDEALTYRIGCLDLSSGALSIAETTDAYLFTAVTNDRGEAWIGARVSYANPEASGGLLAYDVATCTSLTGDDWIRPTLSPYSLSFY